MTLIVFQNKTEYLNSSMGSVEPQIYKTLELGQNFDLHLFESWLEEGGK